jgi:peptidoglycan/xylan/chitin deacetylase (PgdA/CDA1 family)
MVLHHPNQGKPSIVMRHLVKSLLSAAGYYRIRYSLSRSNSGRLLILMYHDLQSPDESPDMAAAIRNRPNREHFDAQMNTIASMFRTLSVEDAILEIKSRGALAMDTVAITFDDGYASAYEVAYPVLKKHGIPVTVFLTTGWIKGEFTPWWETLADIIAECSIDGIRSSDVLEEGGITLPDIVLQAAETVQRKAYYDFLAGVLRDTSSERAEQIVDSLADEFQVPDIDSPKPLSVEQIKEMSRNGMRFGAHTVSHPNLGMIDTSSARRELLESMAEVEDWTQDRVIGTAYTYGQDRESYQKIAGIISECGYSYSCTAIPGLNNADTDPYMLLRETLPNSDSIGTLRRELYLDFASGDYHHPV